MYSKSIYVHMYVHVICICIILICAVLQCTVELRYDKRNAIRKYVINMLRSTHELIYIVYEFYSLKCHIY